MKLFLKTKDFSVSKEDFELHHDIELDMLVTKPQPKNLNLYYESEAYISHTDAKTSFLDKVYHIVKRHSLKKKLRLITALSDGEQTLLDFGAGTGDFLTTAKNAQWKVEGVEPNKNARLKADKKGVRLVKDLTSLKAKKFKVITLWHVLEHLPDLKKQIADLTSMLDNKGTLVVAVPNFKSFDAKHYGRFWAAYDVPRHLWHFSKKAIEKLFQEQGMEVVGIKPMVFDAYYVSLLSEKYKKGHQNFIRAFHIGFLSNLKAKRSKEYSSHIYLLQKRV